MYHYPCPSFDHGEPEGRRGAWLRPAAGGRTLDAGRRRRTRYEDRDGRRGIETGEVAERVWLAGMDGGQRDRRQQAGLPGWRIAAEAGAT